VTHCKQIIFQTKKIIIIKFLLPISSSSFMINFFITYQCFSKFIIKFFKFKNVFQTNSSSKNLYYQCFSNSSLNSLLPMLLKFIIKNSLFTKCFSNSSLNSLLTNVFQIHHQKFFITNVFSNSSLNP